MVEKEEKGEMYENDGRTGIWWQVWEWWKNRKKMVSMIIVEKQEEFEKKMKFGGATEVQDWGDV